MMTPSPGPPRRTIDKGAAWPARPRQLVMLDRDLDVQVPNVHPKPKRGQVGDKDDWCATSLFKFLFLLFYHAWQGESPLA